MALPFCTEKCVFFIEICISASRRYFFRPRNFFSLKSGRSTVEKKIRFEKNKKRKDAARSASARMPAEGRAAGMEVGKNWQLKKKSNNNKKRTRTA